jgi:hypothetical protein
MKMTTAKAPNIAPTKKPIPNISQLILASPMVFQKPEDAL